MNDFVTIMTFSHSIEITVLRSRLEADGIECFLKDEYTVDAHPFYSNAIGGVKLQVREKDVLKATEILQENGYLNDTRQYRPKLLILADKYTAIIPFIRNMQFEFRLIIIVSFIALIFSLILHYASSIKP